MRVAGLLLGFILGTSIALYLGIIWALVGEVVAGVLNLVIHQKIIEVRPGLGMIAPGYFFGFTTGILWTLLLSVVL